MLGLATGTELRLAAYGIILAGIAGFLLYVHHAGYEACKAPQVAAQKAQKANDTRIDQGVSSASDQSKAALVAPGGAAASAPPRLIVCEPSRLPARPAAAKVKPSQLASSDDDRGMPGGAQVESPVDLGPIVQDLALAGVLLGSNGELLWKRDVEQAQPAPK
jgi:hypothetical protein